MATKLAPRKNYSLSGIGTDADPFKVATGGVRTNELETIGTVTPGEYVNPTLTVDAKGRVTEIADGTAPGNEAAPDADEQLAVTAAAISVPNIHNATVIMHFRGGILQSSNQYTVSPNTITPHPTNSPGSYVSEDLKTYWW